MQKLYLCFFTLFLLSMSSFANVRYNPTQLQQFETTGSCQNCDLTDIAGAYGLSVNYGVETPYDLRGANLSGTRIAMQNDTLSNFSGVIAVNSIFDSNCYSQANFENAILIDSSFQYANLTYSDFTGANVTGASFANADLYGAKGIDFSVVSSVCDAIMPDGSQGACK